MHTHREFDALFAKAMGSVEALTGDSFVKNFEWGRFDRVIDVGGSKATKALTILKQHPNLRALVIDRAQVIRDTRQFGTGTEASLGFAVCRAPCEVPCLDTFVECQCISRQATT
jgi:hypothetical protein